MSSALQQARVVSFEDARHSVEQHAALISPAAIETADLLSASGRVLAEVILADRDFPPFHRATRDGYAVRSPDVAQVPARLQVVGEVKAGDLPDRFSVGKGQAASIMTGAGLPPGADAVVMVEYTKQAETAVEIQRSVSAGENFVPRASEARQGQLLLERGVRLDYSKIALAAAAGRDKVQVFRKPRVAVLATGDEIVEIDTSPGPAQIRNSNTYSLAAQVRGAGGEPVVLPIAPDEPKLLRSLIEEGLHSDLLLMTGGVSMGKYDFVEQVLSELHAEFHFTGAQIQPGRPVVFGSCGAGIVGRQDGDLDDRTRARMPAPHSPAPDRKYFFGLPGNPVSTMVTFRLFVQPIVEALCGMKPGALIFLKARLKSEIHTKTGLTRFLPALLSGEFENCEVELVRWQGSGDIAALSVANCYLVIPPDREKMEAGEWVSILTR
jgi:molybdopterin molybdotransferase